MIKHLAGAATLALIASLAAPAFAAPESAAPTVASPASKARFGAWGVDLGAIDRQADPGDDFSTLATQWFIVSDLGLTAFKGQNGVHVFVRSLASAEPVANAEIRLVARKRSMLSRGWTSPQVRGSIALGARRVPMAS